MMAGDVEMLYTTGADDFGLASDEPAILAMTSSSLPEGEMAPDLVAFAKALDAADVTFFGAVWCPACTEQKKLFGDGAQYLPFIDVTNADRTLNALGQAENITTFPTWEFPDGTRATGALTLQEISTRSGVAIPQSDKPTFAAIGSQSVAIGSPLHIPVDAYNPAGGPITLSVEVANPALLEAVVLSGNRSLRINVAGYGDMVFELFEDKAPRPAQRVIQLATADPGFYNGTIFHRIVEDFVIQGGDPTGTGTGGSNLGNFDDQFHPDLQHNRKGILSFAKSSDDTNNSQFFITDGPTRTLDMNHSIFGQLVEGEKVRQGIQKISNSEDKGTNANDKPLIDIKINTATVFDDNQNAVVMLKAKGNQTGSTTVRFTATNAAGEQFTEVVPVTIVSDSGLGSNTQPYLNPITLQPSYLNTSPVTIQLSSVDVEGDAVEYFISSPPGAGVTAAVNATTGLLTVTPTSTFVGTATLTVGVRPASGVVGALSGQSDTQRIQLNFVADNSLAAPTSIGLDPTTDTGASNSDGITNAGSLKFNVAGVKAGAEVLLFAGSTEIGRGTASGTSIVITTNNLAALGDGTYQITAKQSLSGETSPASAPLSVTFDATQPVRVTSFPTTANAGNVLSFDLTHPEEGQGLSYGLTSSPTGAAVNAQTGLLTWTPTASQIGNQALTLTLTDLAGNVRSETFNINVADVLLGGVRLEVTDLSGTVIQRVQPGQDFLLKFYASDLRTALNRSGVFSAYTDVNFNGELVGASGANPITFSPNFGSLVSSGTVVNGLINELGAVSNSLAATNRAEDLIASVKLRALAQGTVEFVTDAADVSGNDFLLFGQDDPVGSARVNFGKVSLEINNRFVAANDTFQVVQGSGAATLDVLANDTFANGVTGTLTLSSLGAPSSGGTVSIVNNKVRYQHAANFVGTETFTYVVRDETGVTQTATASVTVTSSTATSPTAVNDTFTIIEDAEFAQFNVLTNDRPATTGSTIRITAIGTPSKGGVAEIVTGGEAIRYRPAANFVGTETVTYTIADSGGGTATATATFIMTAVNDPPPAGDITRELFKGNTDVVVANLADYGVNVDGTEALTVALVGSSSAGGTFSVNGTSIRYTPASSTFVGTDFITYKTTDPGGLSSTGKLTVKVFDSLPTLYKMSMVSTGKPVAFSSAVTATLRGTASNGEAIERTATLKTSNQTVDFTNLPAGNYQVTVPAIPFLVGMSQPQVQSFQATAAGGTLTGSFNAGSLQPKYLRLADFFASSSKDVVFAVVPAGNDSQAVLGKDSTTLVVDPTVSLSANESTVTVRGGKSGATATTVQATLQANDPKVQKRASEGSMRLLRINLKGVTFADAPAGSTPASTTPSAAEGESSASRTTATPVSSLAAAGMPSAEGEDDDKNEQGLLTAAAVDEYLRTLG